MRTRGLTLVIIHPGPLWKAVIPKKRKKEVVEKPEAEDREIGENNNKHVPLEQGFAVEFNDWVSDTAGMAKKKKLDKE